MDKAILIFDLNDKSAKEELFKIMEDNHQKAVLMFNTGDIEGKERLKRVVKADDMAFAIWEMVSNARKSVTREFENNLADITYDVFDGIDAAFKKIYEILEDQHVNIDDLLS